MPNAPIKIEIKDRNKKKLDWIEFIEDKEKETYNINSSLNNSSIIEIMDFMNGSDHEQKDYLADNGEFHYLSCHRIGAKDIYTKNMLNESDFGIDGENALAFLLKKESEPISKELEVKDADITNSLLDQVNYWLSYIVGTTLSINDIKKNKLFAGKI